MASRFVDISFGDIYSRNAKEYFTLHDVAFIKKKTRSHVFPYEFCQIFQNTCQQLLLDKRNWKIWRLKLDSEVERQSNA